MYCRASNGTIVLALYDSGCKCRLEGHTIITTPVIFLFRQLAPAFNTANRIYDPIAPLFQAKANPGHYTPQTSQIKAI